MNNFYYQYPQYLWAHEIYSLLKDYNIIGKRNFLDAPCGNGIISYWLYNKFNISQIELIDSHSESVNLAKKYLPELNVSCQNIFNLNLNLRKNDIWLFINSLYCLENGELVISHLKKRSEYIIGIFPHINHNNYKSFFEKNPGFRNPTELNENETIMLFNSNGYDLLFKKSITYIPYHKYHFRGDRIIFNIFDRFISFLKGAYWISLFKRK